MARVSLSRCSSDVRSSAGATGIVCRAVAAIAGWRVPVAGTVAAAFGEVLGAGGLGLPGRGWVAVLAPFALGWAVGALEGATGPAPASDTVGGKVVAGSPAGGPSGGSWAAGAAST